MEFGSTALRTYAHPLGTTMHLPKDLKNYRPRDLHGSHYGFVCPVETPPGNNPGLAKKLAAAAELSRRDNDLAWQELLHELTRPWSPLSPCKVVWNGRIVGEPRFPDTAERLKARARLNPPCECALCRGTRPPAPCHAVVWREGADVHLDTSPGRCVACGGLYVGARC